MNDALKIADPNLGLLKSMPTVSDSKRQTLIKDWKCLAHYSKDIPTAVLIQNNSSPVILLLGGINPVNPEEYLIGASMFVYDLRDRVWYFAGTMPEPRNYHASVFINGFIYVIGGYSPFHIENGNMLPTNTCFRLKIRTKRWTKQSDMHQARVHHGAVAVDDRVFVLGGKDEKGNILSTVEMHEISSNQWTQIKTLPNPLMGMGITYLDGSIWILGGITNGKTEQELILLDKVSSYDIRHNLWVQKPSLPRPCAFCAAITLRREIWLCGGICLSKSEKDTNFQNSLEIYSFSPISQAWKQQAKLLYERHSASIAKADTEIFIMGGMNKSKKKPLKEVEIYAKNTNNIIVGSSLPQARVGSSAVSLPKDYSIGKKKLDNKDKTNEKLINAAALLVQKTYRKFTVENAKDIWKRKAMIAHKSAHYQSPSITSGPNIDLYHHIDSYYHHKNKLEYAPIGKPTWPPTPDPTSSSSALAVIEVPTDAAKKSVYLRRYCCLPQHVDPNLGLCVSVDNLVKKSKKFLGLRPMEDPPSDILKLPKVEKLKDEHTPVILTLGGLNPREPLNYSLGRTVLKYHPLKNHWGFCGYMPEPRNQHAAIIIDDLIYVTGGYNPDKRVAGEMIPCKTTFTLNIVNREWKQKSDMISSRAHHGMVEFKGKIYVIGGRDDSGRLMASVEEYNIESNKWQIKRSMDIPRMGMAVTTFKEHIWILGGVGKDEEYQTFVLHTVILYDPVTDLFSDGPQLRCGRAFASAIVLNDTIWLCGGSTSSHRDKLLISLSEVDIYDFNDEIWKMKAIIKHPRHNCAVTNIDNSIYIFGGMSSTEWCHLSKNEVIITENCKVHFPKELPLPITGLTAVTLSPEFQTFRTFSLSCLIQEKLS